jgi:hypothetical protein
MSYDISIFHISVKQKVDEGLVLDGFEHPFLEEKDVARFLERLVKYAYKVESEDTSMKTFMKEVNGCPIEVHVFDTEISFSVPFWESSRSAIFEALQDATELSDSDTMALYDPQAGEWTV